MYSPKISEDIIPYLYREAKVKGIPMTNLVNNIIKKHIKKENKIKKGGEKGWKNKGTN